MRKLAIQSVCLFSGLVLAGCTSSHSQQTYSPPPYPEVVTVHEEVIYDSPYTELRKVKDSSGRTIRYEKRVK